MGIKELLNLYESISNNIESVLEGEPEIDDQGNEIKRTSGKFLTGPYAKVPIELFEDILKCMKKIRFYYSAPGYHKMVNIREYMLLKNISTKEIDVDIVGCFKNQPKYLFNGRLIQLYELKDNSSKDNESTDEIDASIASTINDILKSERNQKLFKDLVRWEDDESNIYNDWHSFRRSLHGSLAEAVMGMDVSGVINEDEIYEVYSGSGNFKWYNNEYTIYANGRDPKKGEKPNPLANQVNAIVEAVYNRGRSKDSKLVPGEKEWEGTIVDENVAVDISIIWDRNVWKSTAHLPAQGKFRGRLVTHAEVYSAVFGSMLTAINTGRDVKGSTKAAIEEHFTGHNSLGFFDRLQNKMIDDMSK